MLAKTGEKEEGERAVLELSKLIVSTSSAEASCPNPIKERKPAFVVAGAKITPKTIKRVKIGLKILN